MNQKKKRISLNQIIRKSSIVCLTAYTAPIARLVDKFADIILVGDSVGPVLYGYKSTREVNLEMMIRHAKSVVENSKNAFIVVDMPYGTYERSKHDALKNARRIISMTGAMAVKLEGGEKIHKTIKFLTENNIIVMGHLGMLPQSLKGRPKVFGRKKQERKKLLKEIVLLENAGVFSVVIECTLKSLVDEVIALSELPIIGIGASSRCKGQVVVTEDILGMTEFNPKFLEKYLKFAKVAQKSIKQFTTEVKNKKYPKKNQCYS